VDRGLHSSPARRRSQPLVAAHQLGASGGYSGPALSTHLPDQGRRAVEATAGWAYRPLKLDWLDILFKYSYLLENRPLSITGLGTEEQHHVAALSPIFTLPMRLSISAKFAYKYTQADSELIADQVLSTSVHAFLGLLRLGYRVAGNWELAAEYRVLRLEKADAAGETRHGALFELGYHVNKRVLLGVGYNFSHFSDDELSDLDRDTHGVFLRVTGRF